MPDASAQVGAPSRQDEPVGFHEPSSFANFVSLLALVVAGVAAWRSWRSEKRAERIATSDPWVTLLLAPLVEEIVGVKAEADLFRQFCTVPFGSVERKIELREKLNSFRTDSARRLHMLSALCPQATDLQKARALLSSGVDSFFENAELTLAAKRGEDLAAEYEKKLAEFLKSVRRSVAKITSRQYLPTDDE